MQEAETREREPGTVNLPAVDRLRPPVPAIRLPTAVPQVDHAVLTRRLFVLLPFCMIAGLVAYATLPLEPEPWALACAALILPVFALGLRRSAALPLVGLLCSFWLGLCLLPLHGALWGTTMLTRPAYGQFQARVDEIVSATADARRIVVSGLEPIAGDRAVDITRARLVVPPEPPLAPGDTISASMRLAPVPGPILPGAFDGQFHAFFAGIGAYGNVTGGFALVATGTEWDLVRAVESSRMNIGTRIDAVLDGPSAAIGRAMVVGDQSAIDDDTREVMAASGLAHIYSISGLHLSVVAGGVFFLLRWLLAAVPASAARWPVKK